MSQDAIVFEKVTYTYGEGTPFRKVAVDNVGLAIEKGKITGIIGHTGSGKSTLVQLMNGLLRPTAGKVFLDGEDIWAEPKKIRSVRFRCGMVFQYPEYQLFEETVYKDIAFGPKNMGLDEKEIDRRVRDAVKFVGIRESYLEKSPFELSGGEKRRAAIAGVFAMEPEVLILDEPAAGLDPMGREEILGGIRAYQREKGNTLIIVSHSMEDMARYSQNIIVMNEGKLMLSGTCRDVFSKSEILQSVSLNIPQVTKLMQILKKRGLPIRDDVFTVDEAADQLRSLMERGRG